MRDGAQTPNLKEVRLSNPSRTVSGSSPALTTKNKITCTKEKYGIRKRHGAEKEKA
jgi:hypothetical protein